METFTIKEVADYLKVSQSGIRNLVRGRAIPFFRLGNRLYFKKSSIDLWINNQEIGNMRDNDFEVKIKPLKREVI